MATTRGLVPAVRRVSPERFGIALSALIAAVVVLLPNPINLVLVPGALMALAILLLPVMGLAALVASVPIQDLGAVDIGAGTLTATKLVLGGVVAAFVLQVLVRGQALARSRLVAFFALYLAALMISLLGAQSIPAGLADLYRWSVSFFALLLGLYAVRRQAHALVIVGVMAGGALFEALIGVVQSTLNLGPASFAVGAGVSRAFGTFGKPNSYAAYLELTTPIVASVAVWSAARVVHTFRDYRAVRQQGHLASKGERRALVGWSLLTLWLTGCAIVGLGGIIASFSRGGWMGTIAAITVMTVLTSRRAMIASGVAAILLVVTLAAGGDRFAPPVIRDRFQQLSGQLRFFDARDVMVTDENFAAVERMSHWQTGLAMATSRPLIGVGAGNFNQRFTEFAVHPIFDESQGHAHNYYIHAFAETGVVGLLAYTAFISAAILVCLRAARSAPSALGRAIGIGALGVTTALVVHNLVENLHVLNLGIQTSVVWALAIVAIRFPRLETPRPETTEVVIPG